MLKRTHIAAGVTLTTVAATYYNIKIDPLFMAAAAFGTILSDMDHPRGAINNELLVIHNNIFKLITYSALSVALLYFGPEYFDPYIAFYLVPPLLVIAFSHHRGITHSLSGLSGICLVTYLINIRYGVNLIFPITVGMATHILLDMFNPHGVELFYPNRKNFRFPVTISTGHTAEKVVFYIFLALLVYISFMNIKLW